MIYREMTKKWKAMNMLLKMIYDLVSAVNSFQENKGFTSANYHQTNDEEEQLISYLLNKKL